MFGMFELFLYIACAWCVLGVLIFAYVDKDGKLLVWMDKSPHPLFNIAVILFWPAVLWCRFKGDNKNE